MDAPQRLTRSIVANVTGFFLFHLAMFFLVELIYEVPRWLWIFYVATSIFLHVLLLIFLYFRRCDFRHVDDGTHMDKVLLGNQLTIFRITSAPSLLSLIFLMQYDHKAMAFLLAYTIAAFVSDFFDGKVSRSLNQVSRVGQYLDSSSDYIVLIIVGIAFSLYGLIDSWFFLAAMIRFGAQWVFSIVLFVRWRGKRIPKATMLGKMAVFATMSTFAISIILVFPTISKISFFRDFQIGLELVTCAMLTASLIEKLVLFIRALLPKPDDKDFIA